MTSLRLYPQKVGLSCGRFHKTRRRSRRFHTVLSHQPSSDTDDAEFARLHVGEGRHEWRDEGNQVLQRVRMRPEQHDAKRACAQILLKAQTPVDSHEGLAERGDGVKQRPVIEIGASEHAAHGHDRVPRDVAGEALGHTRIEDKAHDWLGRGNGGLTEQRLAREFEDGDCVLARHAREVLEELPERMAAFDVVDERAHGNARPRETGLTTEAIGGGGDEWNRQSHRERSNRDTRSIAGACSCV